MSKDKGIGEEWIISIGVKSEGVWTDTSWYHAQEAKGETKRAVQEDEKQERKGSGSASGESWLVLAVGSTVSPSYIIYQATCLLPQ